jgi:putative colanic acid biosysnthesis UDP-glucose lipid carrier transferase
MAEIAEERYFFFFKTRTGEQEITDTPFGKRFYLGFKRLFDLLVATVTIVFLLSWLIPLLAVLIKLDSGGPVFFSQRRVGRRGKFFTCLKLRTMVVNDECDTRQALSDDPRITRLGHFLRISSLDELPQFLNVLTGSMSVVGPRPFMPSDNERFSGLVDEYSIRSLVKPGITGMAQVKGYRGPTTTTLSIFHRYQWDAFYVRNASLSLDFRIIRLTTVQFLRAIFSFRNIQTEPNPAGLAAEA